ncbi:Protein kinase C beta type [Bagarius yarrelli]|uniref:Protein kinase C beta type n=1 Tax=Bagarius yarrelli TaxID=175774 RepID=A0A556VWB3_BAGYA|nr:Protein kinase C beta type [Bagarius yarrelli]
MVGQLDSPGLREVRAVGFSPQCDVTQTDMSGGCEKTRRDTSNFDKEFTKMAVELTPTDKLFIMNLDQNEFQGFSYTNPEFVIQV